MRHFAISAANFSISTLVLQKQHSSKHSDFLKCTNQKIRSKPFYRQILSYNTHTHNHFTALLEYVRDHLGEQVPERQNQEG